MKWINFFLIPISFFLIGAMIWASKGKGNMTLTSSFTDKGRIPLKYVMPAAGGQNISPPLKWEGAPSQTKSFALLCVDLHPIANHWVHWMVINIPKNVNFLPEGASRHKMPKGSKELKNSFGFIGYGGPQPPPGTGEHPYVFTIFALDVARIDLPEDASLEMFSQTIKKHVLAQANLTGYFSR
ncbi:YbhB/YbcL family Raf kinase inhibitor-like protein [Thermodesulfatator indicus]